MNFYLDEIWKTIESNPKDWPVYKVLADLYEENGQYNVAQSLRWCAENHKRPQEDHDGFNWFDVSEMYGGCSDDPESDLPREIFIQLPPGEVNKYYFIAYESLKHAFEAFFQADTDQNTTQVGGKMKEITLNILGSTVRLIANEGSGKIESGIERETCPFCSQPNCCFDCDESQAEFSEGDTIDNSESEADVADRLRYNGVCDAIESIILAHASAGIDVENPKYIEGIETTLRGTP